MGPSVDTPAYDVLVTGSSGHLGHALMLTLPTLGFTPFGIDILPSATTNVVCSIADRERIFEVVAGLPSLRHILHTATLHKPHVGSHTYQDFIDTNITGTLALLDAAKGVRDLGSFVFVSTTSTFGTALNPAPGRPAVWIDESVTPSPKNIYGVSKCAAEDLCFLAHANFSIPALVLRTSRFFPEEDDDSERRNAMADDNLKVLELAYRRCDIADVVSACHCAMMKAREVGWGKFIVSAPPPFPKDDTLQLLNDDPRAAFAKVDENIESVFKARGWTFLNRIDRVYDSSKAVRELGWQPTYTFAHAVECVRQNQEWRSELTFQVGRKGYHATSTGVYTKR